jgi:hypothetical protein
MYWKTTTEKFIPESMRRQWLKQVSNTSFNFYSLGKPKDHRFWLMDYYNLAPHQAPRLSSYLLF